MAVPPLKDSHRSWKRSSQLGIALLLLGCIALTTLLTTHPVPVELIGWLLTLSGIAEAAHAFRVRRSDGFLFHLVSGVTAVPIGVLVATHPRGGAVAWMLVFATYFTIVGLFRALSALHLKFPNWGWTVVDGLASLAFGTVMWTAWDWLIPWFCALAVAVSLILRGWASLMLGHALRRQQKSHGEKFPHESHRKQTNSFAPS